MQERKSPTVDPTSINRSPIRCPVATCHEMIMFTSVLTHFMRDHNQSFDGDFREITTDSPALLLFNERYFKREQTTCMGVLVYAGTSLGVPGIGGLARLNSFLPEKYACYTNHLPILILGCKTHFSSMFGDKEVTEQMSSGDGASDPKDDLLVIWLATMDITRPLHCTITVFKRDQMTSRCSIVMVRNLKSSQIASEFIPDDTDCLVLNRGELGMLEDDDESGNIHLELMVHELQTVD